VSIHLGLGPHSDCLSVNRRGEPTSKRSSNSSAIKGIKRTANGNLHTTTFIILTNRYFSQ
jgi:hypothetical protein